VGNNVVSGKMPLAMRSSVSCQQYNKFALAGGKKMCSSLSLASTMSLAVKRLKPAAKGSTMIGLRAILTAFPDE
jgi:hypothetical protein